jgi:hypothetical protein
VPSLTMIWRRVLTLVQTDPALVASAGQAVIALAITLGLHLTAGEVGATEAAAAAAAGLAVAWYTRPLRTAAAVAFATAAGTLLVAFRVPHVTPGAVSAFSVALAAILNLAVTSPHTASLLVLRQKAARRM